MIEVTIEPKAATVYGIGSCIVLFCGVIYWLFRWVTDDEPAYTRVLGWAVGWPILLPFFLWRCARREYREIRDGK